MRPQIHPIPSGTRDVLPDEMRELRDITEAIRGIFEHDGYGEVWTPALEYENVLARGGGEPPAYRVFDDHGEVLALRTDMTVPIARLVSSRYPTAEPPLRFCYFAHAYRGVRPHRGQMREFLQAGIELIGAPAPQGTAEALTVLYHALDAVGLRDFRIGLGDASLYPMLLRSHDVPDDAVDTLMDALVGRDFVALESQLAALGLDDADAELLLRVPQIRGGPEVLAGAEGPGGRRRRRPGRRLRAAGAGGRRAGHHRPRPRAQDGLLHRRGVRRLRPGARRAARRRRALRRPARALRAAAAGRRLRADDRPAAHRADRRGEGRRGLRRRTPTSTEGPPS